MKHRKTFLAGLLFGLALVATLAWTVANGNFNVNQFTAAYPYVNIKSGVQLTNVTAWELVVRSTNAFSYFDSLLVTNDLVGLLPSGHMTNAAGSRVAYLSDQGSVTNGALVGDVTKPDGSGTTTIAAGAVTYSKIQNVSATQRVLGRNTAGAGAVEEVTASQELDWISSTRGALLERGASTWGAIIPGTQGFALLSAGSGADPLYSGNAGAFTNLNGGAITGGVWRVDVPGFALVPADSGTMTFVTNTPGTAQGGIQGAGPSRMMYQVTSTGTNVYLVFPLPYNYDGGTINCELWFTGGTNHVTATTNVVTASSSTFGAALGTAITVTNRVDTVGVTTFWTTNTQFTGMTIGGSPSAGRSVTIQFAVQKTSPAYSITNLLCAHHASVWGTATATQRKDITQP